MCDLIAAYDGQLSSTTITTTIALAQQLGFTGADLHDAVQEVAIRLSSFTYDHAKSNGASEKTAVRAIIRNTVLKMRRSRTRYGRRLAAYRQDLGQEAGSYEDHHHSEVWEAVASLDAQDQAIAKGLAASKSIHELAQKLGLTWYRVQRAVDRIRHHFKAQGLNGVC